MVWKVPDKMVSLGLRAAGATLDGAESGLAWMARVILVASEALKHPTVSPSSFKVR